MRNKMLHQHKLLLLSFFPPCLLVGGCEKPTSTTSTDIIEYARNAGVGAEVKRLDPEAQEYVDHVFMTLRAWEKSTADLNALLSIDEFWGVESNNWRDAEELQTMLATILSWQINGKKKEKSLNKNDSETESSEEKEPDKFEPPSTREEQFAFLVSEVIPKDIPDQFAQDKDAITIQLQKLLIPEFENLNLAKNRLHDFVGDYIALLVFIIQHGDQYDADAEGLVFDSEEITKRAQELHGAIHSRLVAERNTELATIDDVLSSVPEMRDRAVELKQKTRKAGLSTEAELRKFRGQELLVIYYDQKIKNAEQRKRDIELAQKKKEEDANKDDADDSDDSNENDSQENAK